MSYRPDRYQRLRSLLRPGEVQREVEEEFEHHIAERTRAFEAQGMSEAAARAEALRRFGDAQQFQRETSAIDHSMLRERKRMEIFDSARRELSQAARGLLRAPGFTLVALLTLALGIGASTAVYTMLDAVVLNPLPYPNSERLVKIDHAVPAAGADVFWGVATASYFHYGERVTSFEGHGAYWVLDNNLRGNGETFRGKTAQVTANLLPLLGARPHLGRFFRPDEDVPNAPIVAVLGYDMWRREYASDPQVVGKTIEMEGNPVEIIGVAPEGFTLPVQPVDVFYPRRIALSMQHANWHHLQMVARRKPGIALETVQAELMTAARGLHERFPNVYGENVGRPDSFHPRVQDLRESIVGSVSRILWIVLGSVAIVLLVACANVANLFLVRGEARRNELAVRTALGAERTHIAVQSLAETMLVGVAAAGFGIWFAYAGIRLLLSVAPASLPRLSEVNLESNAVWFALGLGLVAGVVFGLFPVFSRHTEFASLREGGRGMTSSALRMRIRSTLVTAQIALALVLLAAGGLMLRSFQRLTSVESGIDTRNVLTLAVSLPFRNYNTYDKAALFWRNLNERLHTLPGVLNVSEVSTLPFSKTYGGCATLWVDPPMANGEGPGCVGTETALPGFFETLGIPVRGRTVTWNDHDTRSGAIVITRALAERLWPGQDAIGKGLRGNGPGNVYFRVVGVAENFRGEGFRKAPSQVVFFPPAPIEGTQLWSVSTALTVVVKTAGGDARQVLAGVRRAIADIDASAALSQVQTMDDVVAASMTATSFTMILLGVAGFMALVLSIVGLYGVISYLVSRRQSEIGIRMALGAPATGVGRMIMMQSLRLGVMGVAIGLLGAYFTTRTLQSLLFEVAPTDPLTLAAASSFLLLTSAAASLVPALRAARVSPLEALRG